jgi:prepilin-type processing-associated H-X9-DG protein
VQLDRVTVQGASSAEVFTRNENMDITNSTITGSVGTNVPGIEADTYATVNVQSSMVTSNTEGICMFTDSTAIVGTSTVVADNGTNVAFCGGSVQGMAGAGPSPKL